MPDPQFALGQVCITPNALNKLSPNEVQSALSRHVAGDWGDCCPEDAAENELAVQASFRIFSVYHTADNIKFWVITEADRSSTTVLLPEDY